MAMWKNENLLSMSKRVKESKKTFKRMREGVGAGYTITFYGIKLRNTKIAKIEKDKYGFYEVTFTSEIVPKKYDFSWEHPYCAIDSKYEDGCYIELDNGGTLFLPITKADIIKGTVTGTYETSYTGENAEDEEWEDCWSSCEREIESKNYIISGVYGGGYVHADITKTIELSSRFGVADEFLDSAEITFSDETVDMMNDCIDMSSHPYLYEDEDYISE